MAAREDAQLACDELRDWSPATAAEAFYELGEIRMRTGDLEGAEDAFRQAHELGREPVPGLALLRLVRGDVNGAAALLDRALVEETRDQLVRARLLPAKVELALAVDRPEEAATAATELREIADRYDSPALAGAATAAAASLALARDDAADAITLLRATLRSWRLADVPYEAARARVLLAEAYTRQGDKRTATLELKAAQAIFDRLGAVPDARRVQRMLASAGGQTARRSFLFTDMVGSTTLAAALGDEAWSTLAAWHDRMLREVFAEYGGEEVDHAGDGFFVSFGDAQAALECAVAVQRRLAEHRADHGFAPSIRMGVHAADAHRVDSGFRGRGVHEAARIAALADGGEILASAQTAGAVGIPHSAPRTAELKGVPEPVEIVSIDWR